MPNHAEIIAKTAEQGGAIVAVGAAATWATGITEWLNQNSAAVLAICGIAGLAISGCGFLVNWYYQHQKYRNELRQKQRRAS